jgi:protoheme IX farnesyltransferase
MSSSSFLVRDYIQLTKPRVTWLILMSTAIGYFFGHRAPWALWPLLHTLIGTGLLASATAALNQWYEREADSKMRRTRNRPLPSRRLAPTNALVFAIALAAVGALELGIGVNWLASGLGVCTLGTYLYLYTPLKQKTWWSTTVGALCCAMPPLIGYAAANGSLDARAWVLYGILFFWQFPHFYAIAWMYRDDYLRAGIRMLPVIEPDGQSTAKQIVLCSILLVPISLLPSYLGMTGTVYAVGAVGLGLMLFGAGVRLARSGTTLCARQVLMASVVYLPILYALMLIDPGRFSFPIR